MNVGRLLEFIDEILHLEAAHTVQAKLQKLDQAMQNVVNQPQDANHQNSAADAVKNFRKAISTVSSKMTPAAWEFLVELDNDWAFSSSLADSIEKKMAENGITPAVVKTAVDKYVTRRKRILDGLTGAKTNLDILGFEKPALEPGTAELGFVVPRDLFDNTLRGLWIEFKQIDRVVALFSEAVIGEREDARLDQLSTSDPSILIEASYPVVLAIGGTITWLLATYKQIVDIKEVRERTRGLQMANDQAVKSFDEHIGKVVEDAVEKRVEEVMTNRAGPRDHELDDGLRWAMRYLMSRIERGMKVEIRLLPPAAPAVEEGEEAVADTEAAKVAESFEKLEEIRQELLFSDVSTGEPVLKLEPPANPEPEEKKPRKRARKAKATKSGRETTSDANDD